jgi:hypothetical protein
MGLLDGGAAALFGELMTPLYLPATLTDTTGTTYTEKGRVVRNSTPRDCLAQVDSCTEAMREAEGYTDTDRGVFILAASLEGEALTGQEITVHKGPYAGTPWRLASPIDRDPAGAYWRARAARVKNG